MSDANIADLIKILAEKGDETYSKVCKVVAVNDTFCDVEPINGDAPISDVKLVGSKTDTPFILIPKVNSLVVVTYTSKSTAYIALLSEIESVKIRGDQYGGLIKVKDLVDKLNALENQVNDILNALKGITVPLAPSGTYPLAPSFATILNLQTTSKSDIENDKVKHG
jgi:hypothetical protein